MNTLDQIRATLSAVRRRSSSEYSSDALDPDIERPHRFPAEEQQMEQAAAPEGERHHGVHDPAERDARGMRNIERAAHARAPIDAVIDPMTSESPRQIEWFVTGPSQNRPNVMDLATGSPGVGFEDLVVGGGGDSGGDSGGELEFDDSLGVCGGHDGEGLL